MAIPVHLQQFKAAGIYRVVFDKSTVLGVDAEILRLVVGYSEQGPFNIPTYVTSVSDFRAIYGDISKKLEKRGVYFHRLAIQALSSGPILCLNLKKFSGETVDGVSINTNFNPMFDTIGTVKLNVEDIYDTTRFWELSADKLNDLRAVDGSVMDQYINISATNTVQNSNSLFIRKASGNKLNSYNISVSDWYSDKAEDMPEYLEYFRNSKVSDFFAEVYVFSGKFTASQVLASSTLKNYFEVVTDEHGDPVTEDGLPKLKLRQYVTNAYGEYVDALEALYNDPTSGALGHYVGSVIPYFKNKQGAYVALDIIFNGDIDTHNMMMTFNTDLLDDISASKNYIDLSGRLMIPTMVKNDKTYKCSLKNLWDGTAYSSLLGNVDSPVIVNKPTYINNVVVNDEDTDLYAPIVPFKDYDNRLLGTMVVVSVDERVITLKQVGSGELVKLDCTDDLSLPFDEYIRVIEKLGAGKIYSVNKKDLFTSDENVEYVILDDKNSNNICVLNPDYVGTVSSEDSFIDNDDTTFNLAGPQKVITSLTRLDEKVNAPQAVEEPKAPWDLGEDGVLKEPDPVTETEPTVPEKEIEGFSNFDNLQAYLDSVKETEGYNEGEETELYNSWEKYYNDLDAYNADEERYNTEMAQYNEYNAAKKKYDAYKDALNEYVEKYGKDSVVYNIKTNSIKASIMDVVCQEVSNEPVSVYGSSVTFFPYDNIAWGSVDSDSPMEVKLAANGGYSIYCEDIYNSTLLSSLTPGDCFLAGDATVDWDHNEIPDAEDGYYDNVYVQDIKTLSDPLTGNTKYYVITFSGEPLQYSSPDGSDNVYLIRIDAPINQEIGNLSPIYLEGYTYLNSKPASTSMYDKLQWQKSILSTLTDYKGLRIGLLNKSDIDYRYIVDTFETFVEEEAKSVLSYLAKEKQSAFAILNFPAVKTFVKCPYSSYTTSKGVFDVQYIVDGANKKKPAAIRFSLPSDGNGASFAAFYTPLRFSDGYVDSIIPAAGLVSNLFMQKYTSRQPYYIIAGPNYGNISAAGLVGPDYKYSQDELNIIEPYGVNCMIYRPGFGTFINANQTAKQTPVSALSKVNVRELVIYLQDEIEKVLQAYQWEFNNARTRNAILDKANAICARVLAAGGLQAYLNVMDESNNTPEIIDNEMAVLSTHIEPGMGCGKMVQELTIYRTNQMRASITES